MYKHKKNKTKAKMKQMFPLTLNSANTDSVPQSKYET